MAFNPFESPQSMMAFVDNRESAVRHRAYVMGPPGGFSVVLPMEVSYGHILQSYHANLSTKLDVHPLIVHIDSSEAGSSRVRGVSLAEIVLFAGAVAKDVVAEEPEIVRSLFYYARERLNKA